jgi:DNA-binding CsgD family transcriptional regulator
MAAETERKAGVSDGATTQLLLLRELEQHLRHPPLSDARRQRCRWLALRAIELASDGETIDSAGSASAPAEGPLTEREAEVAHAVSLGMTNKAIADRLYISAHTVRFHLANVRRKLGAKNRSELAAIVARWSPT